MSEPLTARQRVERLVLVQLLSIVLDEGVGNKGHADVLAATAALSSVKFDLVGDLTLGESARLLRRRAGIVQRCIRDRLRLGHPMAELGFSAFFLFERLLDAEAFVIGRDSALSAALDLILPALERASVDKTAEDRARAKAAEIFAGLQAEGLFPGIAWARETSDA